VLYAGTRKENIGDVKQGFRDEIEKLKNGGFATEQELTEAKNYLIGSFYLDHQRNARKAWYLGWYQVMGDCYVFDSLYPEAVKNVTLGDLQDAAKKYFPGSDRGYLFVLESAD
jgi:predicted Zn-dependent peptidase